MINRYTLTVERQDIVNRFTADLGEHYRPRFNAAPAQLLPILTSNAPQGFSWFYWGLSPERSRNKSVSERIVNRKVEDILHKPAHRKSLIKHRCLIPADGFYFWKALGRRTLVPYRVVLSNKSLFGIAGVWEEFETEGGETQHTFSMITISAPSSMAGSVERIPFILSEEQEHSWLHCETDNELEQILRSIQEHSLDQYSVSPAIEQDSKDLPSMVLPTPPADQFGNLTLFG